MERGLEIDEITGQVVDAAFKLHMHFGPGLLESVYELVLARELEQRGLMVERQKPVSLLTNFGAATMKEGLQRVVNNYRPSASAPPCEQKILNRRDKN